MKVDESEGVRAARARMDENRSRPGGLGTVDTHGIRNKIIESFALILWIALAIGLFSALWQFVTLQWLTAIVTAVSTIVTVGVGFVALDIRDRLIGRL